MALYVTIYLSLMGKQGLREVNEMGYSGAHYLAEKLSQTGKFELAYPDQPFLNEFVVKTDLDIDQLQDWCVDEGMQAGLKLDEHRLLLCVTEMRSKNEIDTLVESIEDFINSNQEEA